jgi:hypothetical protein
VGDASACGGQSRPNFATFVRPMNQPWVKNQPQGLEAGLDGKYLRRGAIPKTHLHLIENARGEKIQCLVSKLMGNSPKNG